MGDVIVRNQIFSAVLGVGDQDELYIKYQMTSFTLNMQANRLYTTASFEVEDDVRGYVGRDASVNFSYGTGAASLSGFVYSVSRASVSTWRVECRGNGARLLEPFSEQGGIDPQEDFESLITSYVSDIGMTLDFSSANLFFDGSYFRSGTKGSALANLCNVVGTDYYERGDKIVIEPCKPVTDTGRPIDDKDIHEYIVDETTVYNNNVGYVTIKNGGSETTKVIAYNKIYCEIDECGGAMEVYTTPNGAIETAKGATVSESKVTKIRTEDVTATYSLYVRLKTPIISVDSVKLNGVAYTGAWHFEQGLNVLYFDEELRGVVSVTYTTEYQQGQASISATPMGRFIALDLFYRDQALLFQAFLNCPQGDIGGGIHESPGGNVTCIVPSEMVYPRGFDVWIIVEDTNYQPEFHFYNGSSEIAYTPTETSGYYTVVERATLSPREDGKFIYVTRYARNGNVGAKSAGTDVPFTLEPDTPAAVITTIVFDQYYPDLEVSYKTPATKYHVQFANIENGDVRMAIIDTKTMQVCEYELQGIDKSNPNYIECVLPQDVPIDIAGQTGLTVSDVAGKTIPWKNGDGSEMGTVTVDSFGRVTMHVTQNGNYELDIKNLTAGTPHNDQRKIVLKVNVNLEGAI